MSSYDMELITKHPRASAIRLKPKIQHAILEKYETGKTVYMTFDDGLAIRIQPNFIMLTKSPDEIMMDRLTTINFIELLTELRKDYENKINTSAGH